MGTQSTVLAWKIPWTEEPGGILSIGLVAQSCTLLKQLSEHGHLKPLSL